MTAAKKAALQAKLDAGLVKPMKQAVAADAHKGVFPFMKTPLEVSISTLLKPIIFRPNPQQCTNTYPASYRVWYCLVQEGKTHIILSRGQAGWEDGAKILQPDKETYNEAAPVF